MCVRKLSELDRQAVLDFVGEEPALNLFIIGDIESYGFNEDFQEVWGYFSENSGELEGVLLRYCENFIPYYKREDFDVTDFMEIIQSHSDTKVISGKEEIVSRFLEVFPKSCPRSTYFCEMKELPAPRECALPIHLAKVEDAQRIFDLIETIEEFSGMGTTSVESYEKKIQDQFGRIYYIENDQGEMISVTQTTAENSKSAMVVGVATREGYRNQGLMSACLSELCRAALSEGKTLCLFYENPKAGSVYHKLGFETIGKWLTIFEGARL